MTIKWRETIKMPSIAADDENNERALETFRTVPFRLIKSVFDSLALGTVQ